MTPAVRIAPVTTSQSVTGGGPPRARTTRAAPRASTPRPRTIERSIASAGIGLEDDGRAVGDDLAHGLADLRRIEAHHDDGIGAHGGGVPHQTVDRLAPRFLEQAGIFVDLAADDGA